MKKQDFSESGTLRILVAICDMVVLCLSMSMVYYGLFLASPGIVEPIVLRYYLVLSVLCYVPVAFYLPPLFVRRVISGERIVERSVLTALSQTILFVIVLYLIGGADVSRSFTLLTYSIFTILLTAERMFMRGVVKSRRKSGDNPNSVVLIGPVEELRDLYQNLKNRDYGLLMGGIFTDDEDSRLDNEIERLGSIKDALPYLQEHEHVDAVYCSLDSISKGDAIEIYRHCENSVTRFYALPIYVSFLRKNMVVSNLGSTIMLSPRPEPLRELGNRALKRLLDIVISACFLLTLFPIIYLVVAVVIKKQSPGPIFFFQKRSGLNGNDFNMIKFRSMHVNEDSDRLQATENDPRKFPFGDFMRRANIDELPQFINVLMGDMSIVGPRPHMLAHTEEYRQLINKYMVRHWVKPGITGWAQVQGFRGETRELHQMEDRVHADIWYVENWTFWLDIRIIYRTFLNTVFHKEENAY